MARDEGSLSSWQKTIQNAKTILAPMVDQSELAWRILSRRHGAQLCYTPMLHASIFVKDSRYRRENLVTNSKDRPLIVQFCANDPQTFLEAATLVRDQCDAVDLNLGCPQAIAKRGHYGAYLQDDWDLVHKMINIVHTQLFIPVTCKIRIFEDIEKTVTYAKMLEAAGCQLLAVHGRVREQKGRLTGVASWAHIKAVKDNVRIPVFANGNVQYRSDVDRCLEETGADGVMIAEGSLYNPTLFEGQSLPVWDVALEYLDIVSVHSCPTSYVRGHLFKLFHHCLLLPENRDLQEELAKAGDLLSFRSVTCKLRDRYKHYESKNDSPFQLPLPVYICQPYIRPAITDDDNNDSTRRRNIIDGDVDQSVSHKRLLDGQCVPAISKRKLKKMLKNPKKNCLPKRKEEYAICRKCHNPKGSKCLFELCRSCCRIWAYTQIHDCPGHRFLFKSKQIKNTWSNQVKPEAIINP